LPAATPGKRAFFVEKGDRRAYWDAWAVNKRACPLFFPSLYNEIEMSYYLVDSAGKFLGDVGSNGNVRGLRRMVTGTLKHLFEHGIIDEEQTRQAIIECKAHKRGQLMAIGKMLTHGIPPIILTDGLTSGGDDDGDTSCLG
jgi:hypothetical protein